MTVGYLLFHLAIHKRGLELELRTYSGLRVQHSTTLSQIHFLYFLPLKVSSSDFRLSSAAGGVTSLSIVACDELLAMSDKTKEGREAGK